MAFELKYQSDFYNVFQKLVSVKIYKKDYEDSEVIFVRTSEVTIEANYKDDNTPVIGTGVKVIVIANSDDMEFLEDLLISYEKQFMCVIEYDGAVAFRGYSLCDLNERQLLPYAAIVLQFTDYLHRLSEHYPAGLKDPSQSISVMRLVTDLIDLAGLDLPLYVNSTLFESSMVDDSDGTDSFLPQVFVQNFQFHTGPGEYDSMYDAINKALQPFSAFIFYYNDQWIIERQEDITRDGNWVKYSGADSTSETSLKLSINKQDGDFQYIETSQIVEYDSGLKTLILMLRDKLLDSLVFNDYTKDMKSESYINENFSDFPASLEYRTWYRHSNVVIEQVGMLYKHMTNWVRWTTDEYIRGLFYNFKVSFNSSSDIPTTMTISYKVFPYLPSISGIGFVSLVKKVFIRFLLRMQGGPYDGYWVATTAGTDDATPFIVLMPTGPPPVSAFPNQVEIDVTVHEGDWLEWTITKEFDFSEAGVVVLDVYGSVAAMYNNFYELLGMDSSGAEKVEQYFNLIILPPGYCYKPFNKIQDFSTDYLKKTFFGDISVVVTPEDIDNKIEYYINQDFVKKEEIELHLFDLPDVNYSNGLLLDDGVTFTKLWISENSVVGCPLYEVFAKGKFRKYGRTIHRLKSRIRCDKILKPFTIITDDNVPSKTSSSGNMTLLLNGFSWDLNNGVYDIVAEEYTEENIIVDGVLYDTDGNAILLAPDTPTGLTAVIEGSRRTKSVSVSWNPVSGVVSEYVLYRKPYWSIIAASWVNEYWVIYRGSEINYRDSDDLFRVYNLPPGTTITYKLKAVNSAGESALTAEVTVTW